MKITIAAVGKMRASPEQELVRQYVKQCGWPVEIRELVAGKPGKEEEGRLLLEALQGCERVIALDERGRDMTSPQFAEKLRDWQDEGIRSLGFCIGGADGLSDAVRARAQLQVRFGAMVWPHLLVRAMLAEQLYRAWSILQNHPYHRG